MSVDFAGIVESFEECGVTVVNLNKDLTSLTNAELQAKLGQVDSDMRQAGSFSALNGSAKAFESVALGEPHPGTGGIAQLVQQRSKIVPALMKSD
jgi:hypothetical protein